MPASTVSLSHYHRLSIGIFPLAPSPVPRRIVPCPSAYHCFQQPRHECQCKALALNTKSAVTSSLLSSVSSCSSPNFLKMLSSSPMHDTVLFLCVIDLRKVSHELFCPFFKILREISADAQSLRRCPVHLRLVIVSVLHRLFPQHIYHAAQKTYIIKVSKNSNYVMLLAWLTRRNFMYDLWVCVMCHVSDEGVTPPSNLHIRKLNRNNSRKRCRS